MLGPVGQKGEEVAQVGPGLDAMHLAGGDERDEDGGPLPRVILADEQPVPATDGVASQLPLTACSKGASNVPGTNTSMRSTRNVRSRMRVSNPSRPSGLSNASSMVRGPRPGSGQGSGRPQGGASPGISAASASGNAWRHPVTWPSMMASAAARAGSDSAHGEQWERIRR